MKIKISTLKNLIKEVLKEQSLVYSREGGGGSGAPYTWYSDAPAPRPSIGRRSPAPVPEEDVMSGMDMYHQLGLDDPSTAAGSVAAAIEREIPSGAGATRVARAVLGGPGHPIHDHPTFRAGARAGVAAEAMNRSMELSVDGLPAGASRTGLAAQVPVYIQAIARLKGFSNATASWSENGMIRVQFRAAADDAADRLVQDIADLLPKAHPDFSRVRVSRWR